MSQERAVPASAVPLEELSSWPEELCRRELPSVLPRLLISFIVTYPHRGVWGRCPNLSPASSHLQPGSVVFLRPEPPPVLANGARRVSEGEDGERGGGGTMAAVTEGMPPFGTGRAPTTVPP